MTDGFEFLGFRFGMHWDKRYGYGPRVEVPKAKAATLRHKIKQLTRSDSIGGSLGDRLRKLNPILGGWANYYRYCVGAGHVFVDLDWYVGQRLYCWMRRKRPRARASELWGLKQPSVRRPTRRLWWDGPVEQRLLGWTPVCRYRFAWMGTPDFAVSSGEPDA